MRIDESSLAFGYTANGAGNPNWSIALGQSQPYYKINLEQNPGLDAILIGMTYCAIPVNKVTTRMGKGGSLVSGNDDKTPIISAALFSKVYVNNIKVEDSKFILLIDKDKSPSHSGRLRLRYSKHNTYTDGTLQYSNEVFYKKVKDTLELAEDACWFVYDITVENQDTLYMRAIIVNKDGPKTYADSTELHSEWKTLINAALPEDEKVKNVLTIFSVEWFKEKANEYPDFNEKANNLLNDFRAKFAPEVLESLEGKDLLTTIFLNSENQNNLCHILEFAPEISTVFGSIKGGAAYKYGLFYSSKGSWMTGSSQKPKSLTEDEAIIIATKLRDNLVDGARTIEAFGELITLEDYSNLHKLLMESTGGNIEKVWFLKYYQMLYPEYFATNYSDFAQRTVLDTLGIEREKYALVRMGQIRFFADKCGISNVMFNKIFWENYQGESVDLVEECQSEEIVEFYYEQTQGKAINKIFYGVPGCGKSYHIQHEILEENSFAESNIVRTTFYQDYSNTDFVGQILPKITKAEDGKDIVEYIFNPGPFTIALTKAIANPNDKIALVVEEINRGNAPTIFGDIFQLLDRDENSISEYGIVNVGIKDYLEKFNFGTETEPVYYTFESIKIPGNLYIYATMNTSDQNVYTLDTAFTRRWSKERIPNDFKNDEIQKLNVPGMKNYTWKEFVDSINNQIQNKLDDLQVNEDKQLGAFFVKKSDLINENDSDKVIKEKTRLFAYKVLEYLWDDVSKLDHAVIFNPSYRTFEGLVNAYISTGVSVFNSGIFAPKTTDNELSN